MKLILVFPKIENGNKIKRILQQSGFFVHAVCTTGTQALACAQGLFGGIVICGFCFPDMNCLELRAYLPPGFEMLLAASPAVCESSEGKGIVCLHMPFRIHELLQTLHMMSDTMLYREKKASSKRGRTKEEERLFREAKVSLMERNHMTEEEAHRYLQKRSMDNGVNLIETAQMILSLQN